MNSVVEKFGAAVAAAARKDPALGRAVLRAGWEAEGLAMRAHPHRESLPADRYLASLMMQAMLAPLRDAKSSAMVSIFTPCELIQEAGLHPYNVEAFSDYLSASAVEGECLGQAAQSGLSETLCSYHRTFIGAAQAGLMPRPRVIVYTNLVCDANLLTFSCLQQLYDVPAFYLDVPHEVSDDSVTYVATQLRELKTFLEENTGHRIDESRLQERVVRGQRTLRHFERAQSLRADRFVPADLVTPLYSAMTANILLGTREEARYVRLLERDVQKAPAKRGKHIYWMHTIPFWSEAVQSLLLFSDQAQIVGDELSQICTSRYPTEDPYVAMAHRVVHNGLNGPAERRIRRGIANAKAAGADGVVWFNHWGCKHTQGISQMARQAFADEGLPMLILDGDGCDRSHGGEGQTLTRLGAFLEMLGADAQ